jgi:hypothetical protein
MVLHWWSYNGQDDTATSKTESSPFLPSHQVKSLCTWLFSCLLVWPGCVDKSFNTPPCTSTCTVYVWSSPWKKYGDMERKRNSSKRFLWLNNGGPLWSLQPEWQKGQCRCAWIKDLRCEDYLTSQERLGRFDGQRWQGVWTLGRVQEGGHEARKARKARDGVSPSVSKRNKPCRYLPLAHWNSSQGILCTFSSIFFPSTRGEVHDLRHGKQGVHPLTYIPSPIPIDFHMKWS